MPLLAVWIPPVLRATAQHRLQRHAEPTEGIYQAMLIAYAPLAAGLYLQVDGVELRGMQNQRGVDHAAIPIEQGEDHIEMDERLGRVGEFLHQHVQRLL